MLFTGFEKNNKKLKKIKIKIKNKIELREVLYSQNYSIITIDNEGNWKKRKELKIKASENIIIIKQAKHSDISQLQAIRIIKYIEQYKKPPNKHLRAKDCSKYKQVYTKLKCTRKPRLETKTKTINLL